MQDINSRNNSGSQPRFTPPGQKPETPKPKPRQIPKRSEPMIQEGFRDLYQPPKIKRPKHKKPKKKFPTKKFAVALAVVLVLSAAGAWYYKKSSAAKSEVASQPAVEQTQPDKLTGNFRFLATGDIITHDSVYNNAKQPDGSYDFQPMLSELKPILEKSPARICHNTAVAAGGNISGYPSFNAPSELINGLSGSGCNVLSLASDHINDKGQAAIDATIQTVKADKKIVISAGANQSAEEQAEPRYFNVGDGQVKFAYFSYTTRQNNSASTPFGVDVYEKTKVEAELKKVKDTADLVIVSICWGKEDNGDIQPEQDTVAQELANAGADVIFGHCPHVVQPIKKLKLSDGSRETIVYYSLGNALNTQLSIENLIGGLGVIDFDLETKKITNFGFMPTYMHYEWTAAEKASQNLGARKNLKLYPLDKAKNALAKSQNGTTVEAQTDYAKNILNKFTPTKVYSSKELLSE